MTRSLTSAAVAASLCFTLVLAPQVGHAASPALPVAVGVVGSLISDWWLGPEANVGLNDYVLVPLKGVSADDCIQLHPNKFNNAAQTQAVKKGEVYQVLLKRMKLSYETVKGVTLSYLINGHHQMAVLVKGFEMSSQPGQAGFDFSPDSGNTARVVYYSDDVKAGQVLNFSQINMFGPAQFQGNPIGISLFLTRIHGNADKKISPVLSSLATLGKTATNPDVVGALEVLGTRLLEGQDQRLFRYDAMLIPGTDKAPAGLFSAVFAYGDYVMVRMEDRSKPFNWEDHWYKPSTGVLHTEAQCQPSSIANVSHAVIQVAPADQVAYAEQAVYQDLRKAVATSAAATTPSTAQEAIKGPIDRLMQAKLKKAAIDVLEQAAKPTTTKPSPDFRVSLEKVLNQMESTIQADQSKQAINLQTQYSMDTTKTLLLVINDAGIEADSGSFKAKATLNEYAKKWQTPPSP